VTVPESAAQQHTREQERELRQQQEVVPDVQLQPIPSAELLQHLPSDETPRFKIEQLRLQGEASQQFQWALAAAHRAGDQPDSPLGRCLGATGINLILKRVHNAIVQRGFITTQVVAEPQNLASGTLVLTLIPGRLHQIYFSEHSDKQARVWNALPAQPGDLLNLRDIEQALENFKRLPSVTATFQIAPASDPDAPAGTSDLIITWQQRLPLRGTLSLDDSGNPLTRKYQGGFTLAYDQPSGFNDLFYINLRQSFGPCLVGQGETRGHTLHYGLPWGYWYLELTHTQEAHDYSSLPDRLDLRSGGSASSEAKLSYLLYRDAHRKTTLSFKGFRKSSDSGYKKLAISSRLHRQALGGWGSTLAHREFIGRAILDASLSYQRGTGAFGAQPVPKDLREGTPRFKVINLELSLKRPVQIAQLACHYQGSWNAQINRTSLPPSERFSIGSRYSVRGFGYGDPLIPLSAERGWWLRNEFGVALGQTGQEVYLGLDYGKVSGPLAHDLRDGRRLAGAVLGLRGQLNGLSTTLFTSWPLKTPKNFTGSRNLCGFSLLYSF
jgi:hemolysin activation/secretion protein